MGGRAFRNMGCAVRPIMLDEYLKLLPVLGTELKMMGALKIVPIGSTGKVQVMGDIDMAVEHPKGRNFLWTMFTKLYANSRLHSNLPQRFGSRQLTVCYPFEAEGCSKQGLDNVQLDLQVGPVGCTTWLEWAYHSPGDASQCKGVIRNLLLNTITRETGTVVQNRTGARIKRLSFDWGVGMSDVVQLRTTKGGTRTIESSNLVTDPDKVVNIIFGPGYGAKDVLTFDDAVGALKKTSPRAREILRTFVDEMRKLSHTKQHHFGNTILVCNTVLDYIDRVCS